MLVFFLSVPTAALRLIPHFDQGFFGSASLEKPWEGGGLLEGDEGEKAPVHEQNFASRVPDLGLCIWW